MLQVEWKFDLRPIRARIVGQAEPQPSSIPVAAIYLQQAADYLQTAAAADLRSGPQYGQFALDSQRALWPLLWRELQLNIED